MKYLITGGSGGLGRALVEQIQGDVVTLGREDCDINVNLAGDFIYALPSFDVVIHCAGVNRIKAHNDILDKDIAELMAVNAISQFHINRIVLNNVHPPKQIVHVISDAAWTPMTHSLAYNMSKAAQLMVMRQMAHENRQAIIYGVSPGKIANTGMSEYIDNTFPAMRNMTYEQGRAYQMSRLRTGEMEPATVASFIMSLVKMASPHFHGHNFSIGG